MRDFEQSKDIYEHDHTDITRKGNAIIYQQRHSPMYSKYEPDTLDKTKEKFTPDPEIEELRNMGLSKYLRLLSEQKIKDDDISQDELSALKSLTKKYKNKIHYRQDEDEEDPENIIENRPETSERDYISQNLNFGLKEDDDPAKFYTRQRLDRSPMGTPYRRYTALSSLENSPIRSKSILKSSSQPELRETITRDNPNLYIFTDKANEKQVTIAEGENFHSNGFVPDQTKYQSNNNFTVHEDVESLYVRENEEEYETKKSYLLDDNTLYFTNGPFYKNEMHGRVERHHKETVRYVFSFYIKFKIQVVIYLKNFVEQILKFTVFRLNFR